MLKLIECSTAKELLDELTPWNTSLKLNEYVFRGHSNDSYMLLPNSFRNKSGDLDPISRIRVSEKYKFYNETNKIGFGSLEVHQASKEFSILRKFYRASNSHGLYVPRSKFMSHAMERSHVPIEPMLRLYGYSEWLHRDFLEIAALAQHYGLPTRLIDWSYNPYTAAFFASNSKRKYKKDEKISIWLLNYKVLSDLFEPKTSDIKIYNPHYQWNDNARSQFGLFTYREFRYTKDYRNDQVELMNVIADTGIIPTDPKYQYLLTNYETLDNSIERIVKSHNDLKSDKSLVRDDVLVKITLPASKAKELNLNLRKLNITEASIFPGYNGVVDYLKSGRFP